MKFERDEFASKRRTLGSATGCGALAFCAVVRYLSPVPVRVNTSPIRVEHRQQALALTRLGQDAVKSSGMHASNEPTNRAPELDEQQAATLQALLEVELRMPHAEFEDLWRYAVRRDFRLEPDPAGPLRRAIGK